MINELKIFQQKQKIIEKNNYKLGLLTGFTVSSYISIIIFGINKYCI